MSGRDERVYYVWRAHMEGTTDCYAVSFFEHDTDFKAGNIPIVIDFILNDIRSMPASKSRAVKFVVKTIPGPDVILSPVFSDGEYVRHKSVCRWPLSSEEMVKLCDLAHAYLRRVG